MNNSLLSITSVTRRKTLSISLSLTYIIVTWRVVYHVMVQEETDPSIRSRNVQLWHKARFFVNNETERLKIRHQHYRCTFLSTRYYRQIAVKASIRKVYWEILGSRDERAENFFRLFGALERHKLIILDLSFSWTLY